MLPPYDPAALCPKCGTRVSDRWQCEILPPRTAEERAARFEFGEDLPRPERIHRTCNHCGYFWDEAPLDAKREPMRPPGDQLLSVHVNGCNTCGVAVVTGEPQFMCSVCQREVMERYGRRKDWPKVPVREEWVFVELTDFYVCHDCGAAVVARMVDKDLRRYTCEHKPECPHAKREPSDA